MSLPVCPISLSNNYSGSPRYLPWKTDLAGVASMDNLDPSRYDSCYGLVSVPLFHEAMTIDSFRLAGSVNFRTGTKEGAKIQATLFAIHYASESGPYSSNQVLSEIIVDRINDPSSALSSYINITKSSGIEVSASKHTLVIELRGYGQGFASIHGLAIEWHTAIPCQPTGLRIAE